MDLTVTDVLDLNDLYARYTHTIDSSDESGWLDTWADNAVFDLGRRTCTGREGLIGFFRDVEKAFVGRPLRHYTTNISVRADADGATGRAYLLVIDTTTSAIIGSGYYDDTFTRTPSGWRFALRVLHSDKSPTPA